jgi:Flp pilus assembly protein TadB
MKKSLLTLLMTAFCFAAFAMEVPQQDTTKVKQQHSKKSSQKSTGKKSKNWKKSDSSKRDTMNNKTGRMDSTVRPQK